VRAGEDLRREAAFTGSGGSAGGIGSKSGMVLRKLCIHAGKTLKPCVKSFRMLSPCFGSLRRRRRLSDAVAIYRQHVLEPVQGLDIPHRRSARPIEATWRCRLELNRELVEVDVARLRICIDRDARRDGIGQAEVVGRRHPIDKDAGLVAPRERIDHRTIVRTRPVCRAGPDRMSASLASPRSFAVQGPVTVRSNEVNSNAREINDLHCSSRVIARDSICHS
jgi:hypothetical protein